MREGLAATAGREGELKFGPSSASSELRLSKCFPPADGFSGRLQKMKENANIALLMENIFFFQ